MKIFYFLRMFLILVIIAVSYNSAISQDTLAVWTFERWLGGDEGVPDGQELTEPIYADGGLQAETARVGSENMFPDGEGEDIRPWGTPSSGGYVRTSNMVVDTYYRIVGLTTVGFRTIKVSANFGSDSSSRPYDYLLQYRDGTTGEWITVGSHVNINSTSTSNMARQFDEVELPEGSENVEELEIRFLVDHLYGTNAQGRISDLLITGVSETTNVNNLQLDKIRVFSTNGKLNITGASGSNVQIYNLTGAKILELNNVNENEVLSSLTQGQVYIVRVKSKSFKVIL